MASSTFTTEAIEEKLFTRNNYRKDFWFQAMLSNETDFQIYIPKM